MSKPMELTFMSNSSALYALEQLTVDRKYNRGTLEVVKSNDGGEVIGLMCSHHHMMSKDISTMDQRKVKALVDFLKDTVAQSLDEITEKLMKQGCKRANDPINGKVLPTITAATGQILPPKRTSDQTATLLRRKLKGKADALKNAFNQLIEIKKDAAGEKVIGNLKPLSREEIKSIVMGLKSLQAQSIEEFISFDSSNLADSTSEYRMLAQTKGCIHKFAKQIGNGQTLRNDHILTKLEDKAYVNRCGEKDFELIDLRNAPPVTAKSSEYNFEQVFSHKIGSVSKIGRELANDNIKFCTLVRGDTTYNGGMMLGGECPNRRVKFTGFTSQEETVVRNLDPASTAHLLAKGLISMRRTRYGVQLEYARNSDGTRKLSPPDGFMMKGTFESVNNVSKNITPFGTDLLYAAMPPLNIKESSVDIGGCVYYADKCANLISSRSVTDQERANAEKFYSDLLPRLRDTFRTNETKPDIELGKKIMKVAIFLAERFNAFGNDEERRDGIDRLINLFSRDRTGGDLYLQANANYEAVISDRIDSWVQQAAARGDEVFLGSDIGCGEFGNDSAVVGRFFGAAIKKFGGKMKFIYQQGVDGKDKHGNTTHVHEDRRKRFEEGFKEGFNSAYSNEVSIPNEAALGANNDYDGENTAKLVLELDGKRDERAVFTYTLNFISRSFCLLKTKDGASPDDTATQSERRQSYLMFLRDTKNILAKLQDDGDTVRPSLHMKLLAAAAAADLQQDLAKGIAEALYAANKYLYPNGQ